MNWKRGYWFCCTQATLNRSCNHLTIEQMYYEDKILDEIYQLEFFCMKYR